MKTGNIQKALLWIFPLLFFVCSYQLPFWGDGIASVSKAAVRIYQDGLLRPWNFPGADPGHPTLFPWLIALCWKIFGFHIWVPHLLMAIQLHLLARIILAISGISEAKWQVWLLLIVFISPLTVSQALGISLQLPLTLSFFAAYYFLEKNRLHVAIIILCFMMLVHLQAALLYAAFVVYVTWKNWKKGTGLIRELILLSIPGWVFLAWGYFHYQEFGWAFFTPNYERAPPGIGTIIYNLGISAWRAVDLGYFMITLPAMLYLFTSFRRRQADPLTRIFSLTVLVLCVGIPVIFSYPPNHRYIFPVYLLSAVCFIRWLEFNSIKRASVWLTCALLFLISGNFWFYPGKCQGDQNLVHLEFHKLEKEVMAETGNAEIRSYAPLNNASLFTYLQPERTLTYRDLYNCRFDTLVFIMESNLNCEFSEADRLILERDFFVRSYQGKAVFINLYLNKKYAHLYPALAYNRPREKGFMEQKIQSLKKAMGR